MKVRPVYIWAVLFALFAVTRIINLKIIPIFTDEAIYSYWAQIALHDPQNRFISMEDGKQPLFIWLAAFVQNFVSDPLIAGRIVSIGAGLGSLVGIYLLGKKLFGKTVGFLSSFLYITLPFTLMYDRMALFDSLLTMFGIYAVVFTVNLGKNLTVVSALTSAVVVGLGMMTKSSANFFLYLLPASFLFLKFKKGKNSDFPQIEIKKILKWFALTGISGFLGLVMYNALRVSPLFYMISRKNHEFIRTTTEVIADPFAHLSSNAITIVKWLIQYNGIILTVIPILTIVWGFYRRKVEIIFLSMYVLLPFIAEVFFNKVLYPRFVLFYFPFLIILTAYAFVKASNAQQKLAPLIWVLFAFAMIHPILNSYRLLTNPTQAKIAEGDQGQFLNNWPAGYGVSEVVSILKNDSYDKNIFVGTEGTFGLLPFALQIYFYNEPNIQIVGYWPVNEIPKQVIDATKTKRTFFVFNEKQNLSEFESSFNLKLIGKYQKGKGDSYMRLYEVVPK